MPQATLLRRYAIARAALAAGVCSLLLPSGQVDMSWVLTIVVLSVASVAVLYLVQEREGLTRAVVGGDLALGMVMIPVTGAEGSPFLPLLYIAVVFAGTYRGVRGGLGTAGVAALGLHAALLTAVAPFDSTVSITTRVDALWGSGNTLVRLYTAVAFLFLLGGVAGYVGNAIRRRDAQLARAKKELKQRRLDTDTIVESLSTGLISLTSSGRIALINNAACEILDIPELPPDRTASRVLSGRLGALGELLLESLNHGAENNRAMVQLEVPGSNEVRLIGLSTKPVKQDREVVGVVGVFRDITDLTAEEEETRRRERLASIGEVAAGIVHELRNILKPLSGTVELLEGDVRDDAPRLEQVQLIRHECDALEAFLEEILEFAGDAPLEVEATDGAALLERVVSRVRAHRDGAGAQLSVECQHALVIECDAAAIRRMLQNLVLNSVQVRPGVRVVLSASEVEEGILIRVSDDGPGIDAAILDRMFEPFFTTRSSGTGLGLAVAKRTAERHGGTIEARNADGGGAVFEILLPRDAVKSKSSKRAA